MEHQDWMDHQEPLDLKEHQDTKVHLDLLVCLVREVYQDQKDPREVEEILVFLDLKD